jgi:hypothetical protein
MRSVSWLLLEQMMIGTSFSSGSRAIERVTWKPFAPGITTSIRISSGFSALSFSSASSPLTATDTV